MRNADALVGAACVDLNLKQIDEMFEMKRRADRKPGPDGCVNYDNNEVIYADCSSEDVRKECPCLCSNMEDASMNSDGESAVTLISHPQISNSCSPCHSTTPTASYACGCWWVLVRVAG